MNLIPPMRTALVEDRICIKPIFGYEIGDIIKFYSGIVIIPQTSDSWIESYYVYSKNGKNTCSILNNEWPIYLRELTKDERAIQDILE
jgi:hypothetical protein